MRNNNHIRKLVLGSIFGIVILGAGLTANAQNANKEYREWQQAVARAQQEQREYQYTRSNRDYQQWQAALRRAQRQQIQYQRAASRYNNNGNYNGNNNGYYGNNNGYYNTNATRRYRVYNNGNYYMTDSRGAELLRQAVRNGYSQGYRQGQQQNQYGREYDYNGNDMYSSGTYGYQSYVDRNQYQYYFQQGFQRGYEDGYHSRNQYGARSGNSFNILGTVLNAILSFTQN